MEPSVGSNIAHTCRGEYCHFLQLDENFSLQSKFPLTVLVEDPNVGQFPRVLVIFDLDLAFLRDPQ